MSDDPQDGGSGSHRRSNFSEGLEVGYTWYYAHNERPAHDFCSGKSFTNFSYSKLSLPTHGKSSNVSCTVTNTGAHSGAEVAQLYLMFPPAAGEPPRQLKGFLKTRVLQPGESVTVEFPLSERSFSIWDVASHSWQVADGEFGVFVGASSRDVRLIGQIDILRSFFSRRPPLKMGAPQALR